MNKLALISVIFLSVSAIIPILESSAEQITIPIPQGDHTRELKSVIEWYVPINHDVDMGDTVTWVNEDITGHTVTSGKGIGFLGNPDTDKARPDGYFDSGIISPGKSWSFTFKERGFFEYTCTIHPWIERSITVLEPGVEISKDIRISYGFLTSTAIIIVAIATSIAVITLRRNKKEKML